MKGLALGLELGCGVGLGLGQVNKDQEWDYDLAVLLGHCAAHWVGDQGAGLLLHHLQRSAGCSVRCNAEMICSHDTAPRVQCSTSPPAHRGTPPHTLMGA